MLTIDVARAHRRAQHLSSFKTDRLKEMPWMLAVNRQVIEYLYEISDNDVEGEISDALRGCELPSLRDTEDWLITGILMSRYSPGRLTHGA